MWDGSSCGLFQGSVLALVWRNRRKSQITSVRAAGPSVNVRIVCGQDNQFDSWQSRNFSLCHHVQTNSVDS